MLDYIKKELSTIISGMDEDDANKILDTKKNIIEGMSEKVIKEKAIKLVNNVSYEIK
jgi:hypothetical protein